jgi:hypothetical protein
MKNPPIPKITNPHLPPYHFAILFEGAWIFTPEEKGTRILATCPITDDVHEFQFGVWNNTGDGHLDPIKGLGKIEVPRHTKFTVNIGADEIVNSENSFNELFTTAAVVYPFIYLPAKPPGLDTKKEHPALKLSSSAMTCGRNVSMPLPSSVRAAGALLTAEVGGNGKHRLFGQELVVKRAFTTFLFIYQYDDSLTADIHRIHDGHKAGHGSVIAEDGVNPHLIFRIFPPAHMMAGMSTGRATCHASMPGMGDDDDSMRKLHASNTFETVRLAIPAVDKTSSQPCCDMALYHDQGPLCFDSGDVGLTRHELGLPDSCGTPPLFGTKLPACASGGVAAETSGHS